MPHNGSQKKFRIGTGYRRVGNDIIREWNNDEKHYRKFISHLGSYLDDIKDSEPKQGDLYFWGEWEGNSLFKPSHIQLINATFRFEILSLLQNRKEGQFPLSLLC